MQATRTPLQSILPVWDLASETHSGDPEMRSGRPETRSGDAEHRSGYPETRSGDPRRD
jgi:hypothetical protein